MYTYLNKRMGPGTLKTPWSGGYILQKIIHVDDEEIAIKYYIIYGY